MSSSTTQHEHALGDWLDRAFRLGETNLKAQQEMLLGWSRLWATPPGWPSSSTTPFEQLRTQWTDAFQDLAKQQRVFVDEQLKAAFGSLDAILGTVAPSKPAQAAPTPAAPAKVKVEVPRPPAAVKPPAAEPVADVPVMQERFDVSPLGAKNIRSKVAVVTGAASGIGEAVVRELAYRGAKAIMMVDVSDRVTQVADSLNKTLGREVAVPLVGDTTDEAFRRRVFDEAETAYGVVSICVPAAGITRDSLSVKVDKETGEAEIYPTETFRLVTEVNLIAPIYWAIEMVARIAKDRKQRGQKRWEPAEQIQGVIVFLGSVSSQGNKGQISYAVAKAGLEGAAATLMKEAIFYGVRCGIIHPGFTDTPMARSLGEEFLNKYVLPFTQLRRLIRPEEIADAICFMISNSAVSGELWCDAGWHPPA